MKYLIAIRACLVLCLFCSFSFTSWAKDRAPLAINGAQTINLAQAKAYYMDGMAFIDIRRPYQYENRHIPGAINLFVNDQLNETNLRRYVQKGADFIIYGNGAHSLQAAQAVEKAISWGFHKVSYFRDGLRSWMQDRSPLVERSK